MSELSSTSRALLDAARDGMGPSPEEIQRMRAGIDTSVASGATGGALTAKLGLVALVAALAIGAGVYTTRSHAQVTPELSLPAAPVETSAPAIPPATSHIEAAPLAAPPAVHVARPAAVRSADLAREIVLIDQAMAALRGGDALGSLAAIRTHALETHGAGQLAEDAAAIEIEAMCKLHDPRVSARLDAFDEHFPRSAQRSRLTTSCP